MTELESEIKSYHITGSVRVRGSGSLHAHHPDRALWSICGKPMIQWVLEAAKNSKYIDKVVAVTESEAIKEVVKGLGGVTVIDRPLWTSHFPPRDFTQGTFKRNKPRSFLSQEALIYADATTYANYVLYRTEGYVSELRFNLAANAPLLSGEIIDRMIEVLFKDKEVGFVNAFYPILPYLNIINPKTKRPIVLLSESGERQLCNPVYQTAPYSFVGLPAVCNTIPFAGQTGYIIVTEAEGLDVHDEESLFKAQCFMKKRLLKEGKEVEWEIGKDNVVEVAKEKVAKEGKMSCEEEIKKNTITLRFKKRPVDIPFSNIFSTYQIAYLNGINITDRLSHVDVRLGSGSDQKNDSSYAVLNFKDGLRVFCQEVCAEEIEKEE